jgi:hypothetical protein
MARRQCVTAAECCQNIRMRIVFMLGHGSLEWPDFTRLIAKHQITRLIDIRSIALSRWPQFNGPGMRRALPIGHYQHWPELGGHPMFAPPAVRRALEWLLDEARETGEQLGFMCSETGYRQCHRHTLLTPVVRDLGFRVIQISGNGAIEDFGPSVLSSASSARAARLCH